MDSIIYTNSGAPLVTPWSARGMSNETFAALSKADAQKREVESDAMKVLDQPKMKADQDQRNYLRSKIQSIVERLKVLQKLFSNDGREMARAITQIFKELKAALKQYKELAGKELGGVDGMVSQVLAGVPSAPKDDDTAKAEDTNADDTSSDATVKTADAEADAAPATDAQTSASDNKTPTPTTDGDQPAPSAAAFDGDKTALYKAVDAKVRDMVGEDAMDFLKSVRGLVKTIEEKFLAKARIQIAAMKPDKDLERVVKELNDSEKDLNKEMDDMDHDLKAAVPGLGMHLDVAA
ncbi:MAG TPA: hypothetical protein VG942_01595 [Hyphomonadaceae bacterium]|nr:hypothetical protein [Hyphomonadaceae bacterium]